MITTPPLGVWGATYIGGDGYSAPVIWRSEQTTTTVQDYYFLHRDYASASSTQAWAVFWELRTRPERLEKVWYTFLAKERDGAVAYF